MTYHGFIDIVETFLFQTFFLSLQSIQLLFNIRINKVGNVVTFPEFRNDILFPFVISKQVFIYNNMSVYIFQPHLHRSCVTFKIDIVNTGTTIFSFNILSKLGSIRIVGIVFDAVESTIRNIWQASL